MKRLPALKLIIVHYHLRPGGVRRVIELAARHIVRLGGRKLLSVLIAAGEAPDAAWLRAFRAGLAPVPVEVMTLPAFGYFSEQGATGADVRRAVSRLLEGLCEHDAVVWAHNLGLGRNLRLSREIARACDARCIRLVSHHHDWWCEGRWQRWPEFRRCGFGTLRVVADAVLPKSAHILHATINREDAGILQRHFPGRVQWMPNIAEPLPKPSAARERFARAWLRKVAGKTCPVWLMPCRLLRRKNLAEALLLTRWLRPDGMLVTTGGVSSADEQAYAERLGNAARIHNWPLRLGVMADARPGRPSVPELMAASESIVFTSIQEGFGLPALEAAAAARPLIARRLANVARDLAEFGFRFPQSYDEIMIAPELFDWTAEARRQGMLFQRWLGRLPRACRRWAGVPALLAQDAPQATPFSRLTLTAQLEVLSHPAEESWRISARLNPSLRSWKVRAGNASLRVVPWPRRAAKWLSGRAYAGRFMEVMGSTKCRISNAAAGSAAQTELIRDRIGSVNQFPLLWESSP